MLLWPLSHDDEAPVMQPASKQEGITHGMLVAFCAPKYGRYSRACSNPYLRALIVPLQLPWFPLGGITGAMREWALLAKGSPQPEVSERRTPVLRAAQVPAILPGKQENKVKPHGVHKERSVLLQWEAEAGSSECQREPCWGEKRPFCPSPAAGEGRLCPGPSLMGGSLRHRHLVLREPGAVQMAAACCCCCLSWHPAWKSSWPALGARCSLPALSSSPSVSLC